MIIYEKFNLKFPLAILLIILIFLFVTNMLTGLYFNFLLLASLMLFYGYNCKNNNSTSKLIILFEPKDLLKFKNNDLFDAIIDFLIKNKNDDS
jgi:predicted membrane protein